MKPIFGVLICNLCLAAIPIRAANSRQAPAPRKAGGIVAHKTASNPVAVSPNYSKDAYVIEKFDTLYDFHSNGTWEQTITGVVRVQSQAGIQAFGNLTMAYAADNQQVTFAYVRVRKPNGTVVNTPASNAQDQPAAVTIAAPMYSDVHLKEIPVTGLNPGDTLEYQMHLVQNHPQIPNQFWGATNFITDGIALEEHVEVRVPTKKYVKIVSTTVQPTIHQEGDEKVYDWTTSHLTEPSADGKKTAPKADKPSIQITSFQSWKQLGDWYRTLFAGQVVVTPAIRSEERQITAGLTTDEQKQRAIYAYVSTQFRYISLSFGVGRLKPHTADTVLQNKFGDCKDKHTLFAALMQAAGYTVWPALIGSSTKLDPAVPSPAQFNHVISVLPWGKSLIWLDTTEEVAPFGMLMSPLRDKQALVLPANGTPELMTTPAQPPFPESDQFTITGTLTSKAVFSGHAELTLRGDSELAYRAVFHATPREKWNQLGQYLSYALGFAGTVSNLQADDPDNTSKPFHVSYDYTRKDYGSAGGKDITPPLPPVRFSLGENSTVPKDFIPLGAIGQHTFRATVALPKGDVATLVPDKTIQTDFAEYRETSSVKDGTLTAERYLQVKVSKLLPSRWDEYLKFEKAVQARENLMITLAPSDSNGPARADRDFPEAWKLIEKADKAVLAGQFTTAEDLLKRAQAINPTEWGLATTYGDLYYKQNQIDRAIPYYQQEIVNHPDNLYSAAWLVQVLIMKMRLDDAAKVLEGMLLQKPNDPKTLRRLAYVRTLQKRYKDAVTLWEKIEAGGNNTPAIHLALGVNELKAGQKNAGIADLEKAMRTAKEPIQINNAAYELAMQGADLAEARNDTAKALLAMETAAGKTNLAALTRQDLAWVTEMAATWDTLSWIDFKLGRYAQAEPYAQATWDLDQEGTQADHLGQIYAKQGKRAKAAHMYRLALAAGHLEDPAATQRRLNALQGGSHKMQSEAALNRRDAADAKELEKLRTFSIAGLPHQSAFADFYLLLGPHGIEDVRFIHGSDGMQKASGLLKKIDYRQILPDSGPEKIIRRGILTCSAATVHCQFVLLPPGLAWTK